MPAAAQSDAPAQEQITLSSAVAEKVPHFGHDFSRIPVYPSSRQPAIQPKLQVNQPGDVSEQEADQVAEQIMGRAASEPSSLFDGEGESKNSLMRNQSKELEANAATGSPDVPPIVHTVLSSGGGQPLDTTTRAFMEPRFGHDFSQVRVHADAKAAQSAQALNAFAYTLGRHMVFGAGRYAPGTAEGNRLLAHELTHVVQQSGLIQRKPDPNAVQNPPTPTPPKSARTIQQPEGGLITEPETQLMPTLMNELQTWHNGAIQGVNNFVFGVLIDRINELDKGSWKEFVTTMVSGIKWALSAFVPEIRWLVWAIEKTEKVNDIITDIPFPHKDNLSSVKDIVEKNINNIFDAFQGHKVDITWKVFSDHPRTTPATLYRVVGEFVKSFKPGLYSLDESYQTEPHIDFDAVAGFYKQRATDLFDAYTALTSPSTALTGPIFTEELGKGPEFINDIRVGNELAYINVGNEKKLAVVRHKNESYGLLDVKKEHTYKLIELIPEDYQPTIIDFWIFSYPFRKIETLEIWQFFNPLDQFILLKSHGSDKQKPYPAE